MQQSDWGAVDVLIRDLGAIVAAAAHVRDDAARATADRAIREAAVAVNETISDPRSGTLLEKARTAIQSAQDVIVALRGRAFELVEQANKA